MQGARCLRQLEHHHLREQLHRLPSQPWLWLSPTTGWTPSPLPAGRGVRLHATAGNGFQGDLRCRLPLPMPGEAVNAIVIQHADRADLAALIAECSRLLMPGGRLWMTQLNSCSPYRVRWQRHGLRPASLLRCRSLLQREGLLCGPVRYLGPLWGERAGATGSALPSLRAVCVLEAEKRVAGMTPSGVVPVGWRGPVAT
ncbi:class I SAM-dependent methyltransferase [Stenotrophomonas sp. YIM B06876]|uniref:class I SAM-dependent methyltransferase n=1 Tax=Stenotrophomonas sp. YIM B06876 TaxID=3060211 RepID=UPI00273A2CCA|nr:class I SAM-dependent methyltransferase [Stenotrophomonas sp. YIM B06876]